MTDFERKVKTLLTWALVLIVGLIGVAILCIVILEYFRNGAVDFEGLILAVLGLMASFLCYSKLKTWYDPRT